MTIGTITYPKGAGFTFPRSYVYDLVIARYGTTITVAANHFTVHAAPPNPTTAHLVINPDWLPWSSKSWPMKSLVLEWYALVNNLPPQTPIDGTLNYLIDPITLRPSVYFDWFGGFPDYETFPLEKQPQDYWLPSPLT